MKQLPDIVLSDVNAERVRREFVAAIRELQRLLPIVVSNVSLADGVATEVPHGLSAAPRFIKESCIRGASTSGRVEEIRDGVDRTKFVKLRATGYGATITIDLEVVP